MTEQERLTIPAEYSKAFDLALGSYDFWIRDRIRLADVMVDGKLCRVEFVCNLVELFNGTMLDRQYDYLCDRAARTSGTVKAPDDRSYAAGARCLRSLIDNQRRWEQLRSSK